MQILHSDWIHLTTEKEWNSALQKSFEHPVVIFKHSTRCGISSHKLHDLVLEWNINTSDITLYYLDLLEYRSLSNTIASETGIMHQSPQLIIIKEGKAIGSSSHAYATVQYIQSVIDSLAS